MIKSYSFNYNMNDAEVTFYVDTEMYTPEMAKTTLEFFLWDYDSDADPVDEVMKKYAIEAIRIASVNNYNKSGVLLEFMNNEGYHKVDGSAGIILVSVSEFEFDERDLEVKIKELDRFPKIDINNFKHLL